MKKITLLAILLFSIATFAQSNKDLMRRAAWDTKSIEKVKKANNLDSDKKAWIVWKMKGLAIAVTLTDEEVKKYMLMFGEQYQPLRDAYKKYDETKSSNSKVELMKIIVNNEESFRKTLSPNQLVAYLRYGDKGVTEISFYDNFMSDMIFADYKKELQ